MKIWQRKMWNKKHKEQHRHHLNLMEEKGNNGDATNSTINNNITIPENEQKDTDSSEQSQQSPIYTINGVLNFLQHQFNQFELERTKWEIERTELKARITFLIGERKSQENLKYDLVRRIKMLELALRQERAKHLEIIKKLEQPQQNGEIDNLDNDEQFVNQKPSSVPLDIDAFMPPKISEISNEETLSNKELVKARETLQQCLQEIGYTDKILNLRSFRVNQLLGLLSKTEEDEKTNSSDERRATELALLLENEHVYGKTKNTPSLSSPVPTSSPPSGNSAGLSPLQKNQQQTITTSQI
ncbi:hypothetical protein Mgra_00007703 [Meloidogyne graminicola]|uniref:Striatin N-terminal domain-containing protein n=1 Tax=Meloidogyne graminicola TaxID=189291 RepID=A0A8S9ZHW2_9BILA|nr:hypothetical protein Mgra_00007703 [Meloidogyne graminicola]